MISLYIFKAALSGGSALPFSLRANASVATGRVDLTISPKRLQSSKPVENVIVTCKMPSTVTNLNLNASQGSYSFDTFEKLLKWEVIVYFTAVSELF